MLKTNVNKEVTEKGGSIYNDINTEILKIRIHCPPSSLRRRY